MDIISTLAVFAFCPIVQIIYFFKYSGLGIKDIHWPITGACVVMFSGWLGLSILSQMAPMFVGVMDIDAMIAQINGPIYFGICGNLGFIASCLGMQSKTYRTINGKKVRVLI